MDAGGDCLADDDDACTDDEHQCKSDGFYTEEGALARGCLAQNGRSKTMFVTVCSVVYRVCLGSLISHISYLPCKI